MHGNITSMATSPDETFEAVQRSKVNPSSLTCFNHAAVARLSSLRGCSLQIDVLASFLFLTCSCHVKATLRLFSSFLGSHFGHLSRCRRYFEVCLGVWGLGSGYKGEILQMVKKKTQMVKYVVEQKYCSFSFFTKEKAKLFLFDFPPVLI